MENNDVEKLTCKDKTTSTWQDGEAKEDISDREGPSSKCKRPVSLGKISGFNILVREQFAERKKNTVFADVVEEASKQWSTMRAEEKQIYNMKAKDETKKAEESVNSALNENVQYYQCTKCSAAFKFRKYFQQHLSECGTEMLCHICDKKFKQRRNLQAHIRHVHYNECSFQCKTDGCKKKFRSRHALSRHLYTHQNKKFPCDICHKTFSTPCNLKRHKMTHDENTQ